MPAQKTTKPLIIAFGSRARQGKNYACAAIQRAYPNDGISIVGFADALKAYCREHFGMAIKDPPLLQRVGSEMRAIDPDFWVNELARNLDGHPVVLISDLRYENEREWVKAMGGFTVRVTRLNADGSFYVSPDRDPDHPSETALSDAPFDFDICASTGDVEGLESQAVTIYRYIKNQ